MSAPIPRPPKPPPPSQPVSKPRSNGPQRRPKTDTSSAVATPPAAPSQAAKLKLVVRRLPPNLPEEIFWKSVEPWVNPETSGWKVYNQGKIAKSLVVLPALLARRHAFRSSSSAFTFFCLGQIKRTSSRGPTSTSSRPNPSSLSTVIMTATCSVTSRVSLLSYSDSRNAESQTSCFDPLGNEAFAVVEYAVYQKTPVDRKRPDPKQGTIDEGKQAA
jgi:hypothetical protein